MNCKFNDGAIFDGVDFSMKFFGHNAYSIVNDFRGTDTEAQIRVQTKRSTS